MSVLKNLVPGAYANNAIKMHKSKSGCCGTAADICKYTIAVTDEYDTVTAITIVVDGAEVILPLTVAADTAIALKTAIVNALKLAEYDPFYHDSWKGVSILADGVYIIGDVVIANLVQDGSDVDATVSCTVGRICKFTHVIEYDTDPGKISIDGSAGTQIHDTDGFEAGMVLATLAGHYETALGTETQEFIRTDVVKDTVNGAFVVTLHLVDKPLVTIDSNLIDHCGCYSDFLP